MGTADPANGILAPLLIAVALSVLLAGLGMFMRRRGQLRARGPALLWALLTITPLFGAGAAMFLRHMTDEATGVTKPGVSDYRARGAP